jgi:hypothetical protein
LARRITDKLTAGTAGKSPAETRAIIQANINGYLDQAAGQGKSVYQSALAQNSVLVTIYAAVGLTMPEFQWTHVGAFMAHQVRREIINVYDMAENGARFLQLMSAGVKLLDGNGFGGKAAKAAAMMSSLGIAGTRDHIISTLIAGQRTVVTDLVSMALTYKAHGALETAAGLSGYAREGFQLQHEADKLWGAGQYGASRLQAQKAAFKFGVHEQTLLQKMWDDPLLGALGRVGSAFGAVNTNIFVGVAPGRRDGTTLGSIPAPGSGRWTTAFGVRLWESNLNVADLGDRLKIAAHAFDWMQRFVHSNAGNKSTVERAFGALLNRGNHAATPPRI